MFGFCKALWTPRPYGPQECILATFFSVFLSNFEHLKKRHKEKMARPPKKRGLLAMDRRVTHRHSFGVEEKGIVVGLYLASVKQKVPFNAADAGRFVNANRSAVTRAVKQYLSRESMPPTQPAVATQPAVVTKQVKRRPLVKKLAVKRVRADDDTMRAEYPTQEKIRAALPPALRPKSVATISRDLRAEKYYSNDHTYT